MSVGLTAGYIPRLPVMPLPFISVVPRSAILAATTRSTHSRALPISPSIQVVGSSVFFRLRYTATLVAVPIPSPVSPAPFYLLAFLPRTAPAADVTYRPSVWTGYALPGYICCRNTTADAAALTATATGSTASHLLYPARVQTRNCAHCYTARRTPCKTLRVFAGWFALAVVPF